MLVPQNVVNLKLWFSFVEGISFAIGVISVIRSRQIKNGRGLGKHLISGLKSIKFVLSSVTMCAFVCWFEYVQLSLSIDLKLHLIALGFKFVIL